jgi:inosine-uridine nucleoside N-ribohydrolase
MKNFTVISDPGIDDLVALVLLYKLLPKAKNCLIPTFGNAPEELTANNAKEFISFVAKTWSFKNGSKKPFNGNFEFPWPDYFHGPDGVWNIHPDTKGSTIKELKNFPNNENVISLGPLTDAFRLFKKNIFKEITIMGGVFNEKGNETEYAEFNIFGDSDSASKFFNECNGINVKVVPLDVTRKVFWDINTVKNIPENNGINKWLKELLLAWFDKYNHEREKCFNLHDPLAVYLELFPEEAKWNKSGVKVITKGVQRGRTVFEKDNSSCCIAMDLIDPTKIADKIYSLIFNI